MTDKIEPIVIQAVVADDCVFITHPNLQTHSQNYFTFDGKKPQNTWLNQWLRLETLPKKVEKTIAAKAINHRFELRDKKYESKDVPATLPFVEGEHSWERELPEEHRDKESLYKLESDEIPAYLEEVPFKLVVVAETKEKIGDVCLKINAKRINDMWSSTKTDAYVIGDEAVKHQLLDSIVFPRPIAPLLPCELSERQTYDIIRHHIKQNIDLNVCEITSDYDFCFTVKKVIQLVNPYNATFHRVFGTKRQRAKPIKKYIVKRDVEVFEMAPKTYQGYTIVERFNGKNHKDLQRNVDAFLRRLIKEINEPIQECAACKGEGVLYEKSKVSVKSA